MDVLELAKGIEKEGKEYYEKLAVEAPLAGIAGIFRVLAKEEQEHWELFDAWQKKKSRMAVKPGTAGAEAKKAFLALASHFAEPESLYDYSKAYSKALAMEQKSISLYENMLGKSTSAEDKKVLSSLIVEEQKHEHLIEHLIEFVERPKQWLEDAEFNHLDEY
jgi:rubrerythrin